MVHLGKAKVLLLDSSDVERLGCLVGFDLEQVEALDDLILHDLRHPSELRA